VFRDLYSTLNIIEVIRKLYSQKMHRKVPFYWRRYLRKNNTKTNVCESGNSIQLVQYRLL